MFCSFSLISRATRMSDAPRQKLVYAFPTSVSEQPSGEVVLSWDGGADPFNADAALPNSEVLHALQMQRGVLSASECATVIAYGESQARMAGRVELGAESYRVSHIAWIEPDAQNQWLFHKLGIYFLRAAQHFGFELTGFVDALQYTVYTPGQYFDWHMDLGPGSTSLRKLSMTIQLSDNADYEGGALEFVGSYSHKERGAATFFPSYMAHRVAPVSRGTRRSLVAWACGPAFH